MSTKKIGLDALLTPEETVVLLIDHQPFQFANLHSHEPTMVINSVVSLASRSQRRVHLTLTTTLPLARPAST